LKRSFSKPQPQTARASSSRKTVSSAPTRIRRLQNTRSGSQPKTRSSRDRQRALPIRDDQRARTLPTLPILQYTAFYGFRKRNDSIRIQELIVTCYLARTKSISKIDIFVSSEDRKRTRAQGKREGPLSVVRFYWAVLSREKQARRSSGVAPRCLVPGAFEEQFGQVMQR
jgi:hypothetical protein